MKAAALVAVFFALACAPAYSQISAEEAQRKLAEKQAARDAAVAADRASVVTITKGELDDLRSQLAAMKKELAALKVAQPQPETAGDAVAFQKAPPKTVQTAAGLKFVLEIKPGVTRQQLQTFVAQRKDRFRIVKDIRQPDKQELIVLERYETKKEKVGSSYNGVNNIDEMHEVKKPLSEWELVLVNDVITDMTQKLGKIEAVR